jgi:hypothetical protein
MNRIPLSEASDDDLRWFAVNTLQLDRSDVAAAKTRSKLIGLIGPAWDKDFISVPASAVEADDQTDSPVVKVAPENDFSSIMHAPPTTIKVMTTGAPGGKDDAFVSVNTKSLRIKRGVPVTVPQPFLEALQNAVPTVTRQASEDDYELVETEASNYPVQVLTPVDPAAWAAFQARVAQQPLYA